MEIKLYCTPSEPNRVVKTLEEEDILEGTIKGGTSLLKPTILITNDGHDFKNLFFANYMRIDSFNRYYFIDEIRNVRNNLFEISAKVDVLMTYADRIKEMNAIIKRQQTQVNYYLNDVNFKTYQYERVQTKAFPNSFSNNLELLLITAGGA